MRAAAMPSFWRQTWLILRNDVRLSWRQISLGALRNLVRGGLLIAFLVVLHAMFITLFYAKHQAPPLVGETVIWVLFDILMLSGAIRSAVALLYERADFDLLLPSPVSASAILLARLGAIAVSTAATVLLFLLPMIDAAAIVLSPTYLFGYLVWFLSAVSLACLGIGGTLALGRWLGAHRAKTWANVLGVAVGMSVYLMLQLPALLESRHFGTGAASIQAFFRRDAVLLLAKAAHGDWRSLLFLVAVAAVAVTITIALLASTFVRGVQQAQAADSPQSRRRAYRFGGGLFLTSVRKDLRLIARDPVLLVRMLPMAFLFVPIYILGTKLFHADLASILAVCMVAGTVLFSSIFTMLVAAAEVGWDLIRLSPASGVSLRLAKIGAGLVVPGTCGAIAMVAIAALGRPTLAFLTLFDALLSAAALCWLEVAAMKPAPRRDLVQGARFVAPPQSVSIERLTASLVLTFGSTATIILIIAGRWWFAAFGFLAIALTAIASFTLVEMRDLEFEPAADRPRRS